MSTQLDASAGNSPATDEAPRPRPAARLRAHVSLHKKFFIVLGIVVFAGLTVRVANVLVVRKTVGHPTSNDYMVNGDAFYYHWQAVAIGEGQFFVNPARYAYLDEIEESATHPPFYSTYLGVFSAVGLDGVTDHRLASTLMGTVTIALVGLLGRKLAGDRAGLLAAALAAFYPQFWINDGMLLSETAAQFATALMLIAAYLFWQVRTIRAAVWFGLATSLVVLARPELALLFPLVVIPLGILAWKDKPWKERIKPALAGCIAGGLLMSPWLVFNLTRFNEPTLLSTGPWSGISAGTCDEVFYGKYIGYYANCFQGPYPPPSADESEREIEPGKFARRYIENHLDRLPVVVAARVGRLWNVFKPGQNTFLDWWLEGRGKGASWAGLIMFYALVPFALIGFAVMRRHKIPVLPMVALAVITTIAAVITFGVTRYRAPFEVALVAFAAVGLDALWRRWRGRSSGAVEPMGGDFAPDPAA
jgi:4-amino-4-deoxy-L-arabinose transferase-like glycosyltransferase